MASGTPQHKRKVTARIDLDALASLQKSSPVGHRPTASLSGTPNGGISARVAPGSAGGGGGTPGSQGARFARPLSSAGRAGTPRAKVDPALFDSGGTGSPAVVGSPAVRGGSLGSASSSVGSPAAAATSAFGRPHTPRAAGSFSGPTSASAGSSSGKAALRGDDSPYDGGTHPPGVTLRKAHTGKVRAQSIDWTNNRVNGSPGLGSPSLAGGHVSGSASQRSSTSSSVGGASERSPAKQTPTVARAAITPGILAADTSVGSDSTPTPLNRTLQVGATARVRRMNSGGSGVSSSDATATSETDSPHGRLSASSTSSVGAPTSANASASASRPVSPSKGISITEAYRLRKEAAAQPSPSADPSSRGAARPAPLTAGTNTQQTYFNSKAISESVHSPPIGVAGPGPSTVAALASPLNTLSPGPSRWTGSDASGLLSPTSEVSSTGFGMLTPEEVADRSDAKKARKILDLEITNKSLLAINSGLEVTKLKQAKEIRELKRRIREGRLSLAPGELGSAALEDGEFDSESESDGDSAIMPREDPELEAMHARCKSLIDRMVAQAREAILYKYEPPREGIGGKVLHPVELEEIEQRRLDQDGADASTTIEDSLALSVAESSLYDASTDQASEHAPAIDGLATPTLAAADISVEPASIPTAAQSLSALGAGAARAPGSRVPSTSTVDISLD